MTELNDLLNEIKRCIEGYGKDLPLTYLVIGGVAHSLKQKPKIKVDKHGRGSTREYDLKIYWHDDMDKTGIGS